MQTANVQIYIHGDGDRTVVEARYTSYNFTTVPVTASAGREPGDKSDRQIGEAVAAARALRKIAKRLEKQAAGKMKHKEDNAKHALEIFQAKQEEAHKEMLAKWGL